MILSKTYVMKKGDYNKFHDYAIEDVKKYFNNANQYKLSLTIKCNDNCDNNDLFLTLNMYIDNSLYCDINEVKTAVENDIKLHIIDIEKDYDCVFSNVESMRIIFHSDLKDINKRLYIGCRPLSAVLKKLINQDFNLCSLIISILFLIQYNCILSQLILLKRIRQRF